MQCLYRLITVFHYQHVNDEYHTKFVDIFLQKLPTLASILR
ncbi:MAG: hypothetical protein JWQ38_253 [Flavipsychrobacter sp.]|nr:hypothetical protein [Flavipsychrobacter sp.]